MDGDNMTQEDWDEIEKEYPRTGVIIENPPTEEQLIEREREKAFEQEYNIHRNTLTREQFNIIVTLIKVGRQKYHLTTHLLKALIREVQYSGSLTCAEFMRYWLTEGLKKAGRDGKLGYDVERKEKLHGKEK